MNLLIIVFVLASQQQTQCQVSVNCVGAEGREIVTGWAFVPPALFTEESLDRLFDECFHNSQREGQILVLADSALYEARQKTIPINLDDLVIPPVQPKGPFANLFSYKGSRFYQYRDREGQIHWKILTGENLFSKSFNSIGVILVGIVRMGRTELGCAEADTTASFVVAGLKSLDAVQLQSICHFYDSVFAGTGTLALYLYATFEDAATRKYYRFPTIEALAGGYDEKNTESADYVLFSRNRGKARLTFCEKGLPVRTIPIDVKQEQ